jgi:hypothetical protein
MTDWYRRTTWDEAAAADFEARLARARPSSQAQYLSLQGYALLASHPEQAEVLLERAIAIEEPSELPRAACYLALSRVAQDKVDEAIGAYELAIRAERRNPAFRSTASVDQALLIALHERRDLYLHALDQLAMAVVDDWSLAGLEAVTADAIIRYATGETQLARQRALEALDQFPADASGTEWAGISFDEIRARLEAIAQ